MAPRPLAAMTSTYTLKIELQGDIRRLKSWPAEGAEQTYTELQAMVCEAFGLPAETLHLQYRDDEGDLCMLGEATLPDALDLLKASGSNVLRLFASHVEPLTSSWEAVPDSLAAGFVSEHDQSTQSEVASPLTFVAETTAELGSADFPDSRPDVSSVSSAIASSDCHEAPECALQERLCESGCAVRQRVDQAKPRLDQGMQRFKQQVAKDFQTARRDMKNAFDAEPGSSSERPEPLKRIRGAVGVVAGVAVAGRLVPLRATRLAAEAIAAVPNPEDSETAPLPSSAIEPASSSTAALDASADHELAHFAEQVKQDFEVARQEIRDAFGCVMGTSSPKGVAVSAEVQSHDQQQAQPPSQQPSQYKEVIPAAASTLAGITVASTLVPLRAVRLAVAKGRVAAGRVAMTCSAARAGADASTDAVSTSASSDAIVTAGDEAEVAAASAVAAVAVEENVGVAATADVAATAGSA